MAEVAVHFTLANIPDDYVMMTIFIPGNISLQKLNVADLPANWNSFPHHPLSQAIGDQFVLNNQFCALHIPSAVTQGDYNLLINPGHKDFKSISIISIEKFPFDTRIFQ